MHNFPARWTSAAAVAALIALPLAASAQTPSPATPPSQQTPPQAPPAQPPATPQTPPAQDPATATPQAKPAQDTAVDAAAAKQHLSEARDTLSQLTSLPEAAKLQGDARTQVSQLISNFNELITTQSEWRAAYAKLDANLTALLGDGSAGPAPMPPAATGVAGAVGTSGTAPAAAAATGAAQLDPAVRGKLTEFRTHLKAFERAAGNNVAGADKASSAAGTTGSAAATTGTMPAGTATGSTASTMDPANPAKPAAGVSPDSPTATMSQSDQAKAAGQMSHAEADKHLDAISAILSQSKTGTLTKAQTSELKKHVAELRQLLQASR